MIHIAPNRLFLFFLLLTLVLSCEKRSEQENQLLGAWRLQRTKGVNTLLSFRDDHSFEIDQQVEGKLTKSDQKQGKVSGTWVIDKSANQLTMVTQKGDPKIGWPAQTVIFRVVTFDALTLHLMAPDGKHDVWKKVPLSKTGADKNKEASIIKIAPIVVNLAPSAVSANKQYQQYQWICTEVQISLNNYDIKAGLHPRVHEKIIFFLNAKPYEDINTIDKIAALSEDLKKALNPYLDHRINYVTLNNTILTGRQEAVDQFLAKYAGKTEESPKTH
jgi:hypothetical protein